MRYLLNSAVLTSFGAYTYAPLTRNAAEQWLHAGIDHRESCQYGLEDDVPCSCQSWTWHSTIGYQETCAALEQLCGLPAGAVPLHRVQIAMQPGDEALVFRLKLPPGSARIDPKDKGQIARHLEAEHWELGLLTCLHAEGGIPCVKP